MANVSDKKLPLPATNRSCASVVVSGTAQASRFGASGTAAFTTRHCERPTGRYSRRAVVGGPLHCQRRMGLVPGSRSVGPGGLTHVRPGALTSYATLNACGPCGTA